MQFGGEVEQQNADVILSQLYCTHRSQIKSQQIHGNIEKTIEKPMVFHNDVQSLIGVCNKVETNLQRLTNH